MIRVKTTDINNKILHFHNRSGRHDINIHVFFI